MAPASLKRILTILITVSKTRLTNESIQSKTKGNEKPESLTCLNHPSSPRPADVGADPVDVLVVGGGINGAGIARDLAGRGLAVVLCEKDDLASHTSSSSTKLIHGGLRYLEYYEFAPRAQGAAEREVLLGARRTSCGRCAS
jgi:NADPH-dependent 2,4-dienoyl-CoA reductase/sulfur reductase-like enzyme